MTTDHVLTVFAYTDEPLVQALLILVVGLIAGFFLGRFTRRLLTVVGVPELVEGTGTERWLQRMGTSTVSFVASLVALFFYVAALLSAFLIIGAIRGDLFWALATAWLPHFFVAILIVTIGVVIADKVEIIVSERLQGMKLPEVAIIPAVIKYSIIFIALLIGLGQIGVHTTALIVLLTVYLFGLVFIVTIAVRDFLSSGAAGLYLLLREPFSIGDEVTIGEANGIVQEIEVFVTHIEGDDTEYIIPNRQFISDGVRRVRR